MSITRARSLRSHFPQHVDDDPTPIPFRDVQIVDPAPGVDPHARSITKNVQNADIFSLLSRRRVLSAARASVSDERHRALMSQAAAPIARVSVHDALRKIRVDGAFHSL